MFLELYCLIMRANVQSFRIYIHCARTCCPQVMNPVDRLVIAGQCGVQLLCHEAHDMELRLTCTVMLGRCQLHFLL